MALSPPLDASVVTLGTFDGVHRGHRDLISRAVVAARAADVPAVAYTFHPHPAALVEGRHSPVLLQPIELRVRDLAGEGIDIVVVEPFDQAFAAVSADEWVERYLVGQLHPRHVVVGFNHRYGKGGQGDNAHLVAAGERLGFTVEVVDAVGDDGVISSTRIRRQLLDGDVADAAKLLGRPYRLSGVVVKGDQRGRTIGFPTANIAAEQALLPPNGVYATRCHRASGSSYDSVTNIGQRPTFDGTTITIETHLFDFDDDIYGERVEVELVARIRPEKKFEGIEALVRQIGEDAAAAREILAG